MTITRPELCPDCDGRGHRPDGDGRGHRPDGDGGDCSTCGGEGLVPHEVTLSLAVPAGIRNGQTLRLENEGVQTPDPDGTDGDLLVAVAVEPHDRFERDGADLYSGVAVPPDRMHSGGDVEVETLDGAERVSVPGERRAGQSSPGHRR